MAKFKIITNFKMSDKRLVIIGDVIEGEIQIGNWIEFTHKNNKIRKEIEGIEMLDKIEERTAHVGIILKYFNEDEREAFSKLKLETQLVEIHKF